MKLTIQARESKSKSEINRIRREGNVPAVIYDKKGTSRAITIMGDEFSAHLRGLEKGCLATQFFEVADGAHKYKAIVKDITYCRTKYDILHIDLMKVEENDEITIHIPVLCKGMDECLGVTEGGQIKRAKRSVKVTLKAKEVPKAFVLDVGHMRLGDALRVRDLNTTEGMKVRLQESLVLVSVSK